MLSKQQKLRYGQILRQQMREKEEKKKMQEMEKRGNVRQMLPIREQPVYQSPVKYQKENTYIRPYIDPKQQLQKKLESQDYNPFGGSGGGAPNRRMQQNVGNMRNMSQPGQLRMGAEQMMQYSGKNYQDPYNNMGSQRVRTMNEQTINYPGQYQPNQIQSISPQSINYPRQPDSVYYQEGNYPSIPQGRVPNPYQQQSMQNYPVYSNGYPTNRQEPRQPPSFEVLPQNIIRQGNNSRIQQYPPTNNMLQQSYQPNPNQFQPMTQQKSIPQIQQPLYIPPMMDQSQPYEEMNENANQELQQVYKMGGRNLLKLQNQTVDQHLIKQKRKLQIQKQLKQQIQEAQRRKKQQKQRLKRQQQEEQRKHLAYLAEQKRKLQQEERQKRQQKQRIIDQNLRNLEQKKKMQEEAKRKVQQQRLQKQRKQKQAQRLKDDQVKQQQENQRKRTIQAQRTLASQNPQKNQKSIGGITQDDNTSVVSSDTTSQMEKGFNTALSKQFFRKERERNNSSGYQNKKLEQFSTQIQQINNQMAQQRQLMQRQIELMRSQTQKAKIDKKKAQQQIEKLKRELKKKMDDENQKLLKALQGNDFRNNDYHQLPPQHFKNLNDYEVNQSTSQNQYPTFKKPLKQKDNESLVKRQFEVQPPKYIHKQEQLSQFQQSQVGGLISLDGDSKKIPVFLQHNDKLTMSQVQNFAKDSSFFQKVSSNNGQKNSPIKQKYNMKITESIAEVPQEDREYNQSRKSNRYKGEKKESTIFRPEKDQLDRLIDSRAKSRGGWGQMSSVNSDITKEIQQLLRKKESPVIGNNGRPSSISNAGRQTLSKQGYAYDGITLNSNVGGTLNTNGTVDLERINGRNDARLRELKNLGVETINTNGDDDLNALDQLLNKYK